MSERPVLLLLYDISEALDKISVYVHGFNFNDFKINDLVRHAVERNVEIIGEAANKLPEEFMIKYDFIQWRKITGMRNRLIHGYFAVDIPMLWNTVTAILPEFKTQINQLIHEILAEQI